MRTPLLVAFAVAVAAIQQQPPPQRPPVFRAGSHYVRVDAYPTGKDGKIIEGLTREDFEISEDGAPQAIENLEFVTAETWTPEAERKDPRSQEESWDLAGDPRYRVFVIVIDRAAYDMRGMLVLRQPLHDFIDRNLGPRDLFAVLDTDEAWETMVLGQTTTAADAKIDKERWRESPEFDERLEPYYACGLSSLIGRKHDDDTYTLLEGLVSSLSLVRQERKSIVFVTEGLSQAGPIAVPPGGGGLPVPPIGRLQKFAALQAFCAAERQRLAMIDFAARFRDLLTAARAGNVAFYPVSPSGLQAIGFTEQGAANLAAFRLQTGKQDWLRTLASETDGIAVVNTNNLAAGMGQIAADLRSYYVLGYYTTNTKWDGKVRSIKVRLKPKLDTIRARRQYRGPTEAEITALSAPPAPPPSEETLALGALVVRPSASFRARAALGAGEIAVMLEFPSDAATRGGIGSAADVQAVAETADGELVGGTRQKLSASVRGLVLRIAIEPRAMPAAVAVRVSADGGVLTDRVPVPPRATLIGDPVSLRNDVPIAVARCARSDVIRLEWPVLAPLDRHEARLLDRAGQPLAIPLPLVESPSGSPATVSTELALAPLARGDYLVELIATRGGSRERKLFALRVE